VNVEELCSERRGNHLMLKHSVSTPMLLHWKQRLVAPQALGTCVTVAGAQWLSLVLYRWQRKALLRTKLSQDFEVRIINANKT
jgi:hypothetical protein